MGKDKKKKYLDEIFVAPAVAGTTPESSSTIVFNPALEQHNKQAVIEAEKARKAEEQRKIFEEARKAQGTLKADTRSDAQRNRDHQTAVYNEAMEKLDERGNTFNLALGANNTAGGFKLASTTGDMILSPFAAVGGGAIAKPIIKTGANLALKGANFGLSKMGRLGQGIKNAALDVYHNPMRYVMDAAIGIPLDFITSTAIEHGSQGKYTSFGDMVNQKLGGNPDDFWKPMMYEIFNPIGIGGGILADKIFSKNPFHRTNNFDVYNNIQAIKNSNYLINSKKSELKKIEDIISKQLSILDENGNPIPTKEIINTYNDAKTKINHLNHKYHTPVVQFVGDPDNYPIYGVEERDYTLDNLDKVITPSEHKIYIDDKEVTLKTDNTSSIDATTKGYHKGNNPMLFRLRNPFNGYNVTTSQMDETSQQHLKNYIDYLNNLMKTNGIDGTIVGSTRTAANGFVHTAPNDTEIMIPESQLDKARKVFGFNEERSTKNNTGYKGTSPYVFSTVKGQPGPIDINVIKGNADNAAYGVEAMELGEVLNGAKNMANYYKDVAQQAWAFQGQSNSVDLSGSNPQLIPIPKFDKNGNYIDGNNPFYTPEELVKAVNSKDGAILDKLLLDMFSSNNPKHLNRAANLLFKTDDNSVKAVNKALNTIANRIDSSWDTLTSRYPNLKLDDVEANKKVLKERFNITDTDFIEKAANNPMLMENILTEWFIKDLGVSRAVWHTPNTTLDNALSAIRSYNGGQASGIGGNNSGQTMNGRMLGGGLGFGDYIGTTIVDVAKDRNNIISVDDLFKGHDEMVNLGNRDYFEHPYIPNDGKDHSTDITFKRHLLNNASSDAYKDAYNTYASITSSSDLPITGILNDGWGKYYGNVTKDKHYNARYLNSAHDQAMGAVEKGRLGSLYKMGVDNPLYSQNFQNIQVPQEIVDKVNKLIKSNGGITHKEIADAIQKTIDNKISDDLEIELFDGITIPNSYVVNDLNKKYTQIRTAGQNNHLDMGLFTDYKNDIHSLSSIKDSKKQVSKKLSKLINMKDYRKLVKVFQDMDMDTADKLHRRYLDSTKNIAFGGGIASIIPVIGKYITDDEHWERKKEKEKFIIKHYGSKENYNKVMIERKQRHDKLRKQQRDKAKMNK